MKKFPSPCGVRRVRDVVLIRLLIFVEKREFPSPCGVRRVRDRS
jgi:hypothetical protein